ncbi:cytidylyltransferase domain-containing protein [Chloroflexota bacterium]
MKICAIIPARGGSKGIPRKNIRLLAGKPLIAYSIERALQAQQVNRTIVSTEDAEIAKVAQQYGAEVVIRPPELATDTASSESVLLHVLSFLEQQEGYVPSLIVLLQPTSPLRQPDDIDNAINKLIKDKADSLLSLTESREFMWEKTEQGYTSLTFDYKDRKRRQELEPLYYENGAIYVFKPEIIKKYQNRLGGKISVYLMQPWQRVDIDDFDSFEWCEWLYWKHMVGDYKSFPDEIQLIVYDFDGVMTDNKVLVDKLGNEKVRVNRADGLAISRIKEMGIQQIILSTEKNEIVKKRAAKLSLPCLSGKDNKKEALKEYLEKNNISKDKVIFVGNDINDIEVMDYVGFSVAPNDAHQEIRAIARTITRSSGGNGVIRELLDMLLRNDRKASSCREATI